MIVKAKRLSIIQMICFRVWTNKQINQISIIKKSQKFKAPNKLMNKIMQLMKQ